MDKETEDICKENVRLNGELERSEARFHSMVEKSLICTLVLNLQGVVIYLNPAVQSLLGGNVGQFLGENIGIPAKETRVPGFGVMAEGGKEVIFDVHVSEIEWEAKPAFLATLNDINDRKRSEDIIRESEEKFHLLLNSTGEAIYGIDLKGNCTFCNPSCLLLLGYEDESQLLGRYMHDLIHHTRKDGTHYPVEECRIYQAFIEGNGTHVDDEVFWRADGTSFETEYRSFPIIRNDNTVGSVVSFVDITERKQAEREIKALNKSLEGRVVESTADVAKLSHAIKHSSATIVITDVEGHIEYANPRFAQLTGYSIEEAFGKNPGILKSGKTPPEVYKELWKTIKSGNEWKGEFCNRKKKGGLYWESASISPVKNPEGVITNFIAIKDDITDRKQAEEAIQKSNALLTSVIESTDNIIIFILDTSYNYLSFNRSHVKEMKRVYGADIEIGQNILMYIPRDDDCLKAEENYKRVLKGERFVKIEEYGQTNSRFWYELIFNPIYDDLHHVTGFTVFVTDVTDRKRANESATSLAEILEKSLNEIYIFDAKTLRFIMVNKGARLNLDYSMEELKNLNPLDLKPEFTAESFAEIVEPLRVGEKQKIEFITVHRRKDGSLYDVEVHLQLTTFQSALVFVAMILDITERKKMEAALSQSEKLKSIGTITAGISHEFNNLLAIISGNIQLLEGDYKDDKVLTEAFSIIMKATGDGAEISDNMLKFTKTEPDTKEFVSFDIRDLIRHSIGFTRPRWKNDAQARGIDYKMDTEGMKRIPSIMCKASEMREIFINIINNALDAMPGGGDISFGTWSDNDTVFISIADNGEGMSDNVKKNIFDPFFSTKGVEGTGLGMSIVYGIVTRHGGEISVNSEMGNGTTFTLRFPATNKGKSQIETSITELKKSEKKLRILVVDDEEAIRDILNQFLCRDGHTVKTVDNGADAINMVEGEGFDLVLCDIAMPNVCGYDVVKVLNRLKKRPMIGVISGWEEEFTPVAGKESKVDFYLKKPFKHSELVKYINEAFGAGSK